MNGSFARIRTLVQGALELPVAERRAFVERECAGDSEQAQEVLLLLAGGLADDAFLSPPPSPVAASSSLAFAAGAQVGEFRILRELGAGGMGVVYEAEQLTPHRKVALKILRGFTRPTQARRFQREMELLGRLQHPAIARIYSVGVHVADAGAMKIELPYFAMESIEGAVTLRAYARERAPNRATLLRLFATICDAVHHGHQKGVLHRDLKPENILIDLEDKPHIIDFGIAVAIESDADPSADVTATGEIVGTIAYMSPEQMAGEHGVVDVRADIWSLGVVLYELVTGQMPYAVSGCSLTEAARILRERAPVRPSQFDSSVRGDLEAILLMTIETEPDRRYASAAALADDLRRLLAHLPIAARAPSAWRQFALVAKRHRALATAAVLVVTVSVAAAIFSAFQARVARDAEQTSSRRFEQVRGIARALMHEVHDAVQELPGSTAARRLVVDAATTYLAALEAESANRPDIVRELADGYLRLAQVEGVDSRANLGDVESAQAFAEKALAACERLAGMRPGDVEGRRVAGHAHLFIGRAALALSAMSAARQHFEQALKIATELLEHPSTGTMARPAIQLSAERLQALARFFMGRVLTAEGKSKEAEREYELSLGQSRALLASEPLDAELEFNIECALSRLGDLALDRKDVAAAEGYFREAVTQCQRRFDAHPTRTRVAIDFGSVQERLSQVLLLQGKHAEAGELIARNIEIRERVARLDPENMSANRSLSIAWERDGDLRRDQGDLPGALASYTRARELTVQRAEREPANQEARHEVALCCQLIGDVEQRRGDVASARTEFVRAAEYLEPLVAMDSPDVAVLRTYATNQNRLGSFEFDAGLFDAALEYYRRFERTVQRVAIADPEHVVSQRLVMVANYELGATHRKIGLDAARDLTVRKAHLEQSLGYYERAISQAATLRERGALSAADDGFTQRVVKVEFDDARRQLSEL
ncbi:MAG: protein kinase domain-containing protein [Planctomycetota bacterium]